MLAKILVFLVISQSFDLTSSEMMMNYYESQGDYQKALEEAVLLFKESEDPFYLKKMALYSFAMGNQQDGLKFGLEYLKQGFDDEIFFALVNLIRGKREFQTFESYVNKWCEGEDSLSFYIGYLAYLKGDFNRALAFFEKSKPYFLKNSRFLSSYFDVLWKTGNLDSLTVYLNKDRSDELPIEYLRGLYFRLVGDAESSRRIFERIYSEFGLREFGFLKTYLQLLLEIQDFEMGDSVVREIAGRYPFSGEARKLIGRYYLEKGEYDKALSEFLVALGLQKGDPEVHYYLSRTLFALGALRDAIGEINNAIKENPFLSEYHYYKVFLLLNAGELDEGIKWIYYSELKFGKNAYLYYLKAEVFKRKGDFKGAMLNYQRALELDSLNLKRYYDLLLFARSAKVKLDEDYYILRALNIVKSKEDSILFSNLLLELGNYRMASKILWSIIQSGDSSAVLLNNLAYSLAELGEDLEYALELIDLALMDAPNDYQFLDTKALILYKLGRREEAKVSIKRALDEGGKDDPEVKRHYEMIMGDL